MNLYVTPEALEAASHDLSNLGNRMQEAVHTAAPATLDVAPPALDEVSAQLSALFGQVGAQFQGLMGQAQGFQQVFASTMKASAEAFMGTDQTSATGLNSPGQGQDLFHIGWGGQWYEDAQGTLLALEGEQYTPPVTNGEDLFHVGWGGMWLNDFTANLAAIRHSLGINP